ncbi:LPS export ABC transporter periplasmic protein LptC [bacterium]|nr:LPS export ABC transporter periplasmic protein LptC [bacterium]
MPFTDSTEKNTRCIAFLILAGLLAMGCEEEKPPVTVRSDLPNQQFSDARIVITEKGVTSAIVSAKHVDVFEDRNYTVVNDSISIQFFNKEGKRASTLTARHGEVWGLFEQVDSLKATGDVVIVSDERNAKMETQDIRWIAASHKIFSDSRVRLSTEDAVEEGIGFEASDDLKTYTMKNVTGEITREELAIPER